MKASLQCTANGHYQLPLLLKGHDLDLPDNLKMAKHRMQTLKKRFLKDSQLKTKYTETIDSCLFRGHAKPITIEDDERSNLR